MILSDKPKEECGVFGVYSKEVKQVGTLVYYGLHNLQHRGQESAGISIANHDNKIETFKGMGLLPTALSDKPIEDTLGNAAIGHVRYATQGSRHIENAQPFQQHLKLGSVAVAHNGNLINAGIIRELMEDGGSSFATDSDTEVIIKMIGRKASKDGIINAVKHTASAIKGSYALVILADGKLIGVRDGFGIRPLVLGENENGDYFLASESCALDSVGAVLIRDVNPGEMVIIDDNGIESITFEDNNKKMPCSFEYIYFARPDSVMDGISVYNFRVKAGACLAKQKKVDADIVVGVPDSGMQAAIGYAKESSIEFAHGLIKNKYVGRTFIKPSQEMREQAVRIKLNPLRSVVEGKRVILVDDSLVRGTTSKNIIKMMRFAGAKEVHFRLSSPIVKYPCHFGIDIASKDELIGGVKSVDEICEAIGADSLDFLSIENMLQSLNECSYCTGCFTGEYPLSPSVNK